MQRYEFLGEKHYLCSINYVFLHKTMVSNAVKEVTEQDRRKMLASFLYDVAKLMFGSVAVGGLSPLIIGGDFGWLNIVCFFVGSICGFLLAYSANDLLRYKK